MSERSVTPAAKPKRVYVPAIGPRLKKLLFVVFAMLAILGANSLYLASVTFMEWSSGHGYQNQFYLLMFLGHIVLGMIFIVPFIGFGFIHLATARKRKNKRAIRVGYALFTVSIVVLITGLLLVRLGGIFDLKQPAARSIVYWLHVITPLVAMWLYWLHRLVGQKIKWRLGAIYAAVAVAAVGLMISMHAQDPREWNKIGSAEGVQYFEPSLSRTANGAFIPAQVLDNDEYCLSCHADAYQSWEHSAHHFSSFNNPAYLASVRETREVSLRRDGDVKASRWCAGCHDPVPFFSGAFDDPKFDDVNHPTAQAGITCTACHAITHVNSTRGNGDFTIEEPLHYPFAFSDNKLLKWVNAQLIKAKPEFHAKTFLKDFHKSSEFCSTCHKVHIPFALNHYKEFLRGQNSYDSWLLSGVSGHGARSFYYPEHSKDCNDCHMPLLASNDFGARRFEGPAGQLSIHDHNFASGNTGLPALRGYLPKVLEQHEKLLEGSLRVDLFGIKEGGSVDDTLQAPLRPQVPTLKPGQNYLLETVVRTLTLGHLFTQGTADSNEIWLDITLTSGDRVVGRSGGLDARGEVDPWSYFFNIFMLDRDGNRIDRRNPQDIFTPLYNQQIPPGAARVVHSAFTVPTDLTAPLTVTVKLQYRKFDYQYMDFIHQRARPGDNPLMTANRSATSVHRIANSVGDVEFHNTLPILTIASDSLTFPVAGVEEEVSQRGETASNIATAKIPLWQRWNDYGIGLLLEEKSELKQAEHAFLQVEQLNRFDGPLNLARVYLLEGRVDEAVEAVQRAAEHDSPAPPEWTLAWFSGLANREQGRLKEAEDNFRSIVDQTTAERVARGFDFSRDYEVLNALGRTLFDQAEQLHSPADSAQRRKLLQESVRQFERTLAIDSENVNAHYNLGLLYAILGDKELEQEHKQLHLRYKPDDSAQGLAVRKAREKYPAANFAAEPLVIYPLQRPGAPELPR
jgi:tetratricopeptide (TPR) repeat protein